LVDDVGKEEGGERERRLRECAATASGDIQWSTAEPVFGHAPKIPALQDYWISGLTVPGDAQSLASHWLLVGPEEALWH
jgi:hypothetical protein